MRSRSGLGLPRGQVGLDPFFAARRRGDLTRTLVEVPTRVTANLKIEQRPFKRDRAGGPRDCGGKRHPVRSGNDLRLADLRSCCDAHDNKTLGARLVNRHVARAGELAAADVPANILWRTQHRGHIRRPGSSATWG